MPTLDIEIRHSRLTMSIIHTKSSDLSLTFHAKINGFRNWNCNLAIFDISAETLDRIWQKPNICKLFPRRVMVVWNQLFVGLKINFRIKEIKLFLDNLKFSKVVIIPTWDTFKILKIFIKIISAWPSICSQLWFKTTAKYQKSLWKIKTDILKEKCMKVSSKCCMVIYKAKSMYALLIKNFNTFYFKESVREFLMWYNSHIHRHWVVWLF